MNTILCRLKAEFPFVTTRPATEDDFYIYCERHNVRVIFSPAIQSGVYVYCELDRSDHIFLSSRLSGWRLRDVMFHELGHQMFHVPTRGSAIEHFDANRCRRNHREAEAVAAYMLLTVPELERSLIDGDYRRDERLAELIGVRLELYNRNEQTR